MPLSDIEIESVKGLGQGEYLRAVKKIVETRDQKALALAAEMEAHLDYPLDDTDIAVNSVLANCAERLRKLV